MTQDIGRMTGRDDQPKTRTRQPGSPGGSLIARSTRMARIYLPMVRKIPDHELLGLAAAVAEELEVRRLRSL